MKALRPGLSFALALALSLAALIPAAALAQAPAAPAATGPVTPHVPSLAEQAASARIRPEAIRAHVKFLASDLLEGRAPATRGDELARAYVASQMEAAGLLPGGENGTYFQPVEIIGVTSRVESPLTFTGSGGTASFRQLDESISFAGLPRADVRLKDVPVVFGGYGIVAPEYAWDDYKGADVKGKVLLFMNNDPDDDPAIFEGKTRLYYGRWTYKYEQAARMGAIGAIVIHTPESAGYGWTVVRNSWDGERFTLESEPEGAIPLKAWTTEEASRVLVKLGGFDLDALIRKAKSRDFRPVPLGVTVSVGIRSEVRRTRTANVVGKVQGSDPARTGEAVVFTSHHDHLGMKADAKPGEDAIYNGAVDNASGVSEMLEIARAVASLPAPPARTVYFAAVAAEEQGTLGSLALAARPPVPITKVAACLNVDSINVLGRTRDLSVTGFGRTSIDAEILAVAAMQGRTVAADRHPESGGYYRSDQFSFARAGVPAVYLGGGSDFVTDAEAKKAAGREFGRKHYHQPSDEYRESWDLSGAIDDARLAFHVTLRVANAARMPEWKPADEFAAVRKASMEAAGSK